MVVVDGPGGACVRTLLAGRLLSLLALDSDAGNLSMTSEVPTGPAASLLGALDRWECRKETPAVTCESMHDSEMLLRHSLA